MAIDLRQLVMVTGVCVAFAAGCSRGPSPVAVSGTVELDGKPLPEGTVQFQPLDGKTGQSRDVAITNGKFALPTEQGLLPGMEFKVLIKAFKKTGKKYPNADPSLSYDEEVQYLPEKYNTASELRALISANEDENRLTFDLISRTP